MDPLLEQFLQEARENLAFIDQNIEEIGGDDPELLNSVFRAAHTLKGGSGIVGFESVKEITHHAEDLLDMLRAGKLDFKPSMTEALFDAFDEVMNLIEAAEESEEIVDDDIFDGSNVVFCKFRCDCCNICEDGEEIPTEFTREEDNDCCPYCGSPGGEFIGVINENGELIMDLDKKKEIEKRQSR